MDEVRVDEQTPFDAVALGTSQQVGFYHYDAISEAWEWSDEIYALHGYQPGEVEPTTELLLSHKDPADRDEAGKVIAEALLNAEPFSSYHRIIAKDGTVKNVVVVGAGAVDEVGAVVALEGFIIDLTPDVHEHEEAAADEAVTAVREHQAAIEQAKGMIMLTYSIGADAAFELLRYWSMQKNVKLHALAERLVAAGTKRQVTEPDAMIRVDYLIQEIAEDMGA